MDDFSLRATGQKALHYTENFSQKPTTESLICFLLVYQGRLHICCSRILKEIMLRQEKRDKRLPSSLLHCYAVTGKRVQR